MTKPFAIPTRDDFGPQKQETGMTSFDALRVADKAHADAGILAVQLFHIARAVERDEDCSGYYVRALQLYGELGTRLVSLAKIVHPETAAFVSLGEAASSVIAKVTPST